MALIVEDGSIVADANSYVTLTEAKEYASTRGLPYSISDQQIEANLVRSADYLESFDYIGNRIEASQPLSWPRKNAYIYNEQFPDNEIPEQLKKAQCQLALDSLTVDIQQASDGRFVTREKVDVIEVEYSEKKSSTSPRFHKVEAYLRTLLKHPSLSVLRV